MKTNATYVHVRVILQNIDNNCVWNIFSQVVAMSQNIRHNKFCLRLAMKVPVTHGNIKKLFTADSLLAIGANVYWYFISHTF